VSVTVSEDLIFSRDVRRVLRAADYFETAGGHLRLGPSSLGLGIRFGF
jgi:hypothetical protein